MIRGSNRPEASPNEERDEDFSSSSSSEAVTIESRECVSACRPMPSCERVGVSSCPVWTHPIVGSKKGHATTTAMNAASVMMPMKESPVGRAGFSI